ncbi:hypothetical protein, partial [Klebsiella pneumoniae]|uniref:hypothetical protein n=1 Tax=Klebsiella pneumoniae TaxID=573 RepID=UPI004048D4DF
VGDICLHYYDKNGHPVLRDDEDPVIGMALERPLLHYVSSFPYPINVRQPTSSRLRVPKNSETKNSALAVSTIAGPAGRLIAQERLNPSQAQSAPIPAASSR